MKKVQGFFDSNRRFPSLVCLCGGLFTFYSWAMHNAGNVFWFVDGKAARIDSGHQVMRLMGISGCFDIGKVCVLCFDTGLQSNNH